MAAIAGSFLALIMFTGAAVRLTDSGLGCEDWPQCSDERIVPEFGFHAWIEFGNRLLSGAVSVAVGALVWAARRLVRSDPRHGERRLERGPNWGPVGWAWSIVALVVVQIVIGGVTVLVDLHPIFVSVHYLLSIVTVSQAAIVWHLAALAHPVDRRRANPRDTTLAKASWTTVGVGAIVLILGTIVTGTGPNSGDVNAERLALDLEWTVRLHSISAWVFVATIVIVSGLVARAGRTQATAQRLLIASIAQGAVGYVQYATGVPPLLVEIHVIGSVAVWFFAVRHALSLTEADVLPSSHDEVRSGAAIDESAPGPFTTPSPTA